MTDDETVTRSFNLTELATAMAEVIADLPDDEAAAAVQVLYEGRGLTAPDAVVLPAMVRVLRAAVAKTEDPVDLTELGDHARGLFHLIESEVMPDAEVVDTILDVGPSDPTSTVPVRLSQKGEALAMHLLHLGEEAAEEKIRKLYAEKGVLDPDPLMVRQMVKALRDMALAAVERRQVPVDMTHIGTDESIKILGDLLDVRLPVPEEDDYAPQVTDPFARATVGCRQQVDGPVFAGERRMAWLQDIGRVREGMIAGSYNHSAVAKLLVDVAAVDPAMRAILGEEFKDHPEAVDMLAALAKVSWQGDFAPGITDPVERVKYGFRHLVPLTEPQRAALFAELDELFGQAKRHELSKTALQEVLDAMVFGRGMSAQQEQKFAAQLAWLKSYQNRGPVHLVAVEQQLLAYRVNASIEHTLGGLPGALQPATIDALRRATPYCWSPECVEAVTDAASHLPTTAKATPEALGPVAGPDAAGWWWFEQPIPVQTTSETGWEGRVVAFLWRREVDKTYGPTTWGTTLVCEAVEFRGRMQMVPLPTLAFAWPDGMALDEFEAHSRATYLKLEAQGQYGAGKAGVDITMAATMWFARFWLAGGLWLEQRVMTSTRTALPRQPGRALAREHKLAHAPLVEVVHLRRRAQPTGPVVPVEGQAQREWTCRWVVHGFWRRQWYPSTGRHAQKWIDSFMKGPEGKPLRTSTTVYAVDR